ncbi:Uncharacterised protein [Mycobacteroides abscessus subsp. abscessus]|nr:Uncharacterised protein [Mycobacteroides abscessus subsp. abscessus]
MKDNLEIIFLMISSTRLMLLHVNSLFVNYSFGKCICC